MLLPSRQLLTRIAYRAMATTTAPKPAVVLIGITDSHPAIPNDLRDKLRSAIAESRTQMHDAGYHDFVSLP